MASVTQAPPRANCLAPRIAHLRILHGGKGRRLIDQTDPDAMLRELVLVAVDRYEAARDFRELARRLAAANAHPDRADDWDRIVAQAASDAFEQEEALAFLIDASFGSLAPPALEITAEQEAAARHYIGRGFEVAGVAYLLTDDVGNVRPGIIARSVAVRGSTP